MPQRPRPVPRAAAKQIETWVELREQLPDHSHSSAATGPSSRETVRAIEQIVSSGASPFPFGRTRTVASVVGRLTERIPTLTPPERDRIKLFQQLLSHLGLTQMARVVQQSLDPEPPPEPDPLLGARITRGLHGLKDAVGLLPSAIGGQLGMRGGSVRAVLNWTRSSDATAEVIHWFHSALGETEYRKALEGVGWNDQHEFFRSAVPEFRVLEASRSSDALEDGNLRVGRMIRLVQEGSDRALVRASIASRFGWTAGQLKRVELGTYKANQDDMVAVGLQKWGIFEHKDDAVAAVARVRAGSDPFDELQAAGWTPPPKYRLPGAAGPIGLPDSATDFVLE